MKRGSTLFLKFVIAVMALAALAFCIIVLPQTIDDFSWGGYDPILAGMYLTAIPFFLALFQGWKLLTYIDKNIAFSQDSVKALKTIKYAALTISGLYLVGLPYIFKVADQDDAPGVVLIGLIFIGAPFVIAVFAAVLQKLIQSGLDIKSENDLTV